MTLLLLMTSHKINFDMFALSLVITVKNEFGVKKYKEN